MISVSEKRRDSGQKHEIRQRRELYNAKYTIYSDNGTDMSNYAENNRGATFLEQKL